MRAKKHYQHEKFCFPAWIFSRVLNSSVVLKKLDPLREKETASSFQDVAQAKPSTDSHLTTHSDSSYNEGDSDDEWDF